MTAEIVIGPGRSASPTVHGEAAGDLAGQLAGFVVTHPGRESCQRGSWIPINHPGEDRHWTLVAIEPLHLEPSLLCTVCGDHGWIRDGKWVPA